MAKTNKVEKHNHIKNHFKSVDPVIHRAMQNIDFDEWFNPREKRKTKLGYFSALCREIIGQQLAGKAAQAIIDRFINLFEGKRVTPEKVLAFEDGVLREVGMSWAKVKYLKDLSQKTIRDEVELEKLYELPDEAVVYELTKVKGIGPWTAEMLLIFSLGREDVFSFGDLGLRRGIEYLYEIKSPTEAKIKKIVDVWTPYKTYGSIALWHSLDTKVVK